MQQNQSNFPPWSPCVHAAMVAAWGAIAIALAWQQESGTEPLPEQAVVRILLTVAIGAGWIAWILRGQCWTVGTTGRFLAVDWGNGVAVEAAKPGLLLLTCLACIDGNVFLATATRLVDDPGSLVPIGLLSIAGPGSWLVANQKYSLAQRRQDLRLNREFYRTGAISTALTVSACALGAVVPPGLALRFLALFGSTAVAVAAWGFGVRRRPPPSLVVWIPSRGGRRRIVIGSATAFILVGSLLELAAHWGSLTRLNTTSLGDAMLTAMARGALNGLLLAGIAWASIATATRIDYRPFFNPPSFRFFAATTLLLIAYYVAGYRPGEMVLRQRIAQYAILGYFALGMLLSALARRWSNETEWDPGDGGTAA